MKKKFAKILGVGLTLALLCSLLLTAAPVSALSQPSVVLDNYVISQDAVYTISFRIDEELAPTTTKISVTFPEGTVVADPPTATITAWCTDVGGLSFVQDMDTTETLVTDTLTVELVWAAYTITTLGTVVVEFTTGITNPDVAGAISLTVGTQEDDDTVIEATVTSADYEITVPDITPAAGVVNVYNEAGILLWAESGDERIDDAMDVAGAYTIKVGEGEYDFAVTVDKAVTIVGTAGAAKTVIVGNVTIAATATLDNLTIEGAVTATTAGDDSTIKDCVLTTGVTLLTIDSGATGITVEDCSFAVTGDTTTLGIDVIEAVTVTDCSFTVDALGTAIATAADLTLTDSIFTGSSGTGVSATGGTSTISGSAFDGLTTAISAPSGTPTLAIEGNTIANSTGHAISVTGATEVIIVNNNINDTDEDYYALNVADAASGKVYMEFNSLVGNTLNVKGAVAGTVVDATHNWWGSADGPATDSISGDGVDTSAYLGSSVSAADLDVGAPVTSLDAKTDVGVAVSGATDATTIAVAKYSANPQEAIADAIAFFDVYVVTATADVDVTLKFYAGDENSELYVWSADTLSWAELTPAFSAYGGYVYATVDADMLDGTPFALIGVEAVAGVLDAPGIVAPTTGDDDVSLTPIFAWGAVTDADGYYFEFADNANFVTPMVKLDGDLGRLIVTAYAYVTELPYSEPYYWRVKAVSGTVEAGNLAESAWSTGVFITMAEPEEDLPPVVIEETEPPIIIIEPIVEVVTPAATEITPAWIYIIIGVGGVLVIALLVLIVRTRRVA